MPEYEGTIVPPGTCNTKQCVSHDISSYVQTVLFGDPNDLNKKQAKKKPGLLLALMPDENQYKALRLRLHRPAPLKMLE